MKINLSWLSNKPLRAFLDNLLSNKQLGGFDAVILSCLPMEVASEAPKCVTCRRAAVFLDDATDKPVHMSCLQLQQQGSRAGRDRNQQQRRDWW
eukprot:m.139572 g.139572  ORF g.139572 m.139572 type:complete len:94 (+) comp24076_c0_seq4:1104-1385(+)